MRYNKGEKITITKRMREYSKTVEQICLSEKRHCSEKEIAEKLNITQQSAHNLKKRCSDANLIDYVIGTKCSMRPSNFKTNNIPDNT